MAVGGRPLNLPSLPTEEETPQQPVGVRVPRTNNNPIWSLKPWPVVVEILNQEYVIPAMTAADWLPLIMTTPPRPDLIIPLLLPDVEDLFVTRADVLEADDLYWLAFDILECVAARPWWKALRLLTVLQGGWDVIHGKMVLAGVRADQLSLGAWLDAALVVTMENIDPEKAEMFSMQLEAVPTELLDDDAIEDAEMAGAMTRQQFLSMM